MALRVCSRPGCPNLCPGGRCQACRAEADKARGTAAARGYDAKHRRVFRTKVLERDPLCTCITDGHGHGMPCSAIAKHADHWPRSRDELTGLGLDANDPAYGRGLCHSCHSRETAAHQPGGFHAQQH